MFISNSILYIIECPTKCKTCKLGGGKKGLCAAYCSKWGWCGKSSTHIRGGNDCRKCKKGMIFFKEYCITMYDIIRLLHC